MNFRVYSMEELGEIEPDTMGYIDTEGNFWSLGRAKRNSWGGFDETSFEEMGKIVELMALDFLKEKHKEMLVVTDFEINHHLPHFWPADKFLLGLGFCRFFRGYCDHEEPYLELSVYESANSKQLFVMNYLFALNQRFAGTEIESKRKELSKSLIEKARKEDVVRKLRKK